MIYIVLVYLLFLLLYFYRKNRTFDLASAVTFIFLMSVVCGVLIDVFDLYGEYGVSDKTESFPATLCFCLGITAVAYPFSKIEQIDISGFELRKPFLFNCLCVSLVVAFVMSIVFRGIDGMVEVFQDAASVKADYYEDLADVDESASQPLYMYPINILTSAWSLSLCLWFYRMILFPQSRMFNMFLLFASLGGIFSSGSKAGRAAIVYWLLLFILCFFFFRQFMSNKQKKRIALTIGIIGTFAVFLLMIITISRFEDSSDHGSLFSLVGYAGQMFNNFCAIFEVRDLLPINFERILPLTSKYVFGKKFDLLDFYDTIYSMTGVGINRFTTIIGGLVINVGLWGMMLYMVLYNIFLINFFKKMKGALNVHQLVILSYVMLAPVKGLFGLPFSTVSDTLLLFFSVFLYVVFKYKLRRNEFGS